MLLTKLHIPPVSENVVQRQQLLNKLNSALHKKLTLISAPAGFGKTTCISDWIHTNKIKTIWYSIDKGDNDPVGFFSYLIAGVQQIQPDFGKKATDLLKSQNKPANLSIAVLLINEIIDIHEDFLMVFDDFHFIDNSEVFELVSFFLEHIPENIHVVILTRSDPALPIARLRSKNQLGEIRASDLCFSSLDISVLFNKKIKLGLSVEDIQILEDKTEGWIAGLQLTALSMQGRKNISAFINELKGDNRYIMDYLLEEVLKNQPKEIQEFLLKTSILEQISAPLCNKILNREDSQTIIERLENNNMFIIPLDDERKWYRYHHLFADLLKQKLFQTLNDSVFELHSKTLKWFEENNRFDLAIDHALAIKDYDICVNLISHIVEEMWINGQHAAILRYGHLIPYNYLVKNPQISLFYAWVLLSNGQQKKAEPYLVIADKSIEQKENNILAGKIYIALAYLYSYEDKAKDMLKYCEKALPYFTDTDDLWLIWIWYFEGLANFSLGNLNKSNIAFQKAFDCGKRSNNIILLSSIVVRMADVEQQLGHYKSAFNKCIELLAIIEEKGVIKWAENDWAFAGLYSTIGITQLMWAEFDKAYENINKAYSLSKNSMDILLKSHVLLAFLGVLYMMNNKVEAESKEKEFEELIKNNIVPPFMEYYALSWKVYRLFESDQLNELLALFKQYNVTLDGQKDPINDMAYSMYARLLIKLGQLAEAETLLDELMHLAEAGKRVERIIDLKMIYSKLYNIKGEMNLAIENMIQALEMAAPENLLMYVIYNIDSNSDLYKTIYNLQSAGKTNIPKTFIEKFKLAVERQEKIKKSNQESELSPRELDILALIAENLYNQEIADKLFISLNTVKTHLKNIYLKLDVDNRTKAVARAKELKII